MNYSKIAILLFSAALIMVSCEKDKRKPGYTYFPDMAHSPAYKSYSENPVFANGATMQLPPEGAIPRGYSPYPYQGKSLEEQEKAGRELTNPFTATEEIVAEGRRQYDIFCITCHGPLGDGNGHLFTSGLFPAKPRSLVDDYLKDKPDGEIFHVITMGSVSGLMPSHGGQITSDNRWRIITYIRQLAENAEDKP